MTTGLIVLWCTYSLNGFRGWWVPISLSDGDSGSAIRQALFAGSAMVSVCVLWLSRRFWSVMSSQWPLALLAAWLMLTTLYSDLPSTTAKRSILFACGAATAVVAGGLARFPLRDTSTVLVAITTIAAWMSLLWWIVLPQDISTNPGRPGLAGISNHPNTLAPAMAIGLVLALGLDRHRRSLRIAALLGCGIALILTGSVTSIFACLVSLAVYASLHVSPYWRMVACVVACGFAAAVVLLDSDAIAQAMLGSVGRDTSMSGRSDLWSTVWSEVRQAWVFGHGWGAFWIEGRGRELVGTWNPRQSHNAYLDVLLDLGVVGLVVCALAIGRPVLGLARFWKSTTGADRHAAAASLSLFAGLFGVYALQQSFIGKVDAFAFIAILLLLASPPRSTGDGTGPGSSAGSSG